MAMPDPYKKPTTKPTATYGPPIPSASTVPAPPTNPQSSQQSAQAWINNPDSGQGGMDTYTKVQNERWNTANQNKDYDAMKKLQSDAQRVGYTLNPYKPPEVKAPNPTAPTQFADWQAKQNELMQKYESMLNTQFQYNAETDPRYQAFQTLSKSRAEAAAKDANKATMETMNDRGLLNSSLTTSQLSQNENKFRQQAETEALAQLPQFYSEARQDYQDRLRNAANMLSFAAGRGDAAADMAYRDNRATRSDMESDRSFDRGAMESDRNFDRGVLENDRTFDRGVLENDRAFDYQVGRDQVGDQRYDQEFEYKQARDQIADEQYKQKFDEDVRRFGLNYAMDQAKMANQFANAAADNARANAQLDLQRQRFDFDKQQASQPKEQKTSPSAYKSSPEYAQDYQFVKNSPEQAKQSLQTNAADFINEYGFDGYMDLLKGLPKEDQDETMKLLESILGG